MKWLRYSVDGETFQGYLAEKTLHAVSAPPWGEWRELGIEHKINEVKIEVPVIPPTFYAAGLNYVKHIMEVAESRGEKPLIPATADIGYRAVNALIADQEEVIIPVDAGEKIHYEAELVVVIGKKIKNVSEQDALSAVFGYTIGNDVSERDWQKTDRTFFRSKNSDTFKPMGPWIETNFDIGHAKTRVKVNGIQTIEFDTKAMLFDVSTFISRTSKYVTFFPGDVIWMGTDGTSPNIRDGDKVEIEITGLGTLTNTFSKPEHQGIY